MSAVRINGYVMLCYVVPHLEYSTEETWSLSLERSTLSVCISDCWVNVERLIACQIPTVHYRRIRGDMIETYSIITAKYQGCVAPSLIKEEIYVTRWDDFRLQKLRVRYDLSKFGTFFQSSGYTWNRPSFHNWVVSAYTTDTFKARLDKFWHSQGIVYDFRTQLQGTGSRSEVLCEKF